MRKRKLEMIIPLQSMGVVKMRMRSNVFTACKFKAASWWFLSDVMFSCFADLVDFFCSGFSAKRNCQFMIFGHMRFLETGSIELEHNVPGGGGVEHSNFMP
eukprot:scaffold64498_cov43-Cyclotella_meneghiniana.AAC.2